MLHEYTRLRSDFKAKRPREKEKAISLPTLKKVCQGSAERITSALENDVLRLNYDNTVQSHAEPHTPRHHPSCTIQPRAQRNWVSNIPPLLQTGHTSVLFCYNVLALGTIPRLWPIAHLLHSRLHLRRKPIRSCSTESTHLTDVGPSLLDVSELGDSRLLQG